MIDHPIGDAVLRRAGDVASWAVLVGAFADALPKIATAASLIWTLIQVSDWAVRKLRARRGAQ